MPPEPMNATKRLQKVRQACDCCHARKIRCDAETPCKNCRDTDLHCTYLAVPKKKGPKGRRTVKETKPVPIQRPRIFDQPQAVQHPIQRGTRDVSTFNGLEQLLPDPQQFSKPTADRPVDIQTNGESRTSLFQPSPILSDDLIKTCLDAFFTHKYPIMPVLDREVIYTTIPNIRNLPDQYGLISALCALIVLQPEIIDPPMPGTSWPSSETLINEALRSRPYCDHIENPSLSSVHTSFFLFAALFALGKDNSAWFYIRESMTILQILRLHEEGTYKSLDSVHSKYCRRTFWLLFITERGYALQRQHRPVTLQRTIELPTVNPGSEATILSGFIDLVSLFSNFDDSFFSSDTDSTSSPQSLVQLQNLLQAAIPNPSERTEIQQADLLVSRQWLKTMVWQVCVSKGFLSSTSANESMSFHYPVSIARDMVQVSRNLSAKAFEANGVGILEKVFDIGCSLSDVLSLHPIYANNSGLEFGPKDYLMELVRVLGTSSGGEKYLRLLMLKANDTLQGRIRGSLSDSDASERIEEIEDEDDLMLGSFPSDVPYGPEVPPNDRWITSNPIGIEYTEHQGQAIGYEDQQLSFTPLETNIDWTANLTATYPSRG